MALLIRFAQISSTQPACANARGHGSINGQGRPRFLDQVFQTQAHSIGGLEHVNGLNFDALVSHARKQKEILHDAVETVSGLKNHSIPFTTLRLADRLPLLEECLCEANYAGKGVFSGRALRCVA